MQGRIDLRNPQNRFWLIVVKSNGRGLPRLPDRWAGFSQAACREAAARAGLSCLFACCSSMACPLPAHHAARACRYYFGREVAAGDRSVSMQLLLQLLLLLPWQPLSPAVRSAYAVQLGCLVFARHATAAPPGHWHAAAARSCWPKFQVEKRY